MAGYTSSMASSTLRISPSSPHCSPPRSGACLCWDSSCWWMESFCTPAAGDSGSGISGPHSSSSRSTSLRTSSCCPCCLPWRRAFAGGGDAGDASRTPLNVDSPLVGNFGRIGGPHDDFDRTRLNLDGDGLLCEQLSIQIEPHARFRLEMHLSGTPVADEIACKEIAGHKARGKIAHLHDGSALDDNDIQQAILRIRERRDPLPACNGAPVGDHDVE